MQKYGTRLAHAHHGNVGHRRGSDSVRVERHLVLRAVLSAWRGGGGVFPGVVFYFTQWLPQKERGKAIVVFLGSSAFAFVI